MNRTNLCKNLVVKEGKSIYLKGAFTQRGHLLEGGILVRDSLLVELISTAKTKLLFSKQPVT